MYDIDKHQLNLGQFKILNYWDEFSFKKYVFLHFFTNECIIISYFKGKNQYHIKEEETL